jgi:hypothetical protein
MSTATTLEPRRFTSSGSPKRVELPARAEKDLPPISQAREVPLEPRFEVVLRELARTQQLQYYLQQVVNAGHLSQKTASLAWEAWKMLNVATSGRLPVPDACPGPDGQLLYTWDKREHHFEVEIFPEGLGEFFYMNRVTDETWEHDYSIADEIPGEVKTKLRIFGLYDA